MRITFKQPTITTQEVPGSTRFVAVELHIEPMTGGFVTVRFSDAEDPNETNASEKSRIKAKAKEIFLAAANAL